MQTNNRIFDDIARVVTGAAGAAQGVRDELQTALRLRLERAAHDLDLVAREDFEVVRLMAEEARAEVAALRARVAELEARLAAAGPEAAAPGAAPDAE